MSMKVTCSILAGALLAGCAANSHYHGQEGRAIKALSDDEVAGYLAGAGMGFARSAELNRHPGPMHALENAGALQLSQAQRQALEDLMRHHKEEVRALGAEVVRLERDLDRLFAERRASAEAVDRLAAEIGAAQAKVRASHLKTHLLATTLLTPAQVDRYVELRGYGSPDRESRATKGTN